MKKLFLLLVSLSPLITTPSFADETHPPVAVQESQSYGSKVERKAVDGLINIGTAALEIPKNILNVTNDSNVALGVVGGVTKGILNTVGRLVSGVVDLITAPIPTQSIVQPAHIWDDFDVDTTYGEAFRLQSDAEKTQNTP